MVYWTLLFHLTSHFLKSSKNQSCAFYLLLFFCYDWLIEETAKLSRPKGAKTPKSKFALFPMLCCSDTTKGNITMPLKNSQKCNFWFGVHTFPPSYLAHFLHDFNKWDVKWKSKLQFNKLCISDRYTTFNNIKQLRLLQLMSFSFWLVYFQPLGLVSGI